MTITVKKIGGSVGLLIPKSLAQEMELREGTPLEISGTADEIVIRKQRRYRRRLLKDIVSQIKTKHYQRRNKEVLNEGPAGKEMW